jgi:hypothetical protein
LQSNAFPHETHGKKNSEARAVAFFCCESNGKEQIQTAMAAVRQSPHKRISLEAFAKNYLEGEAKEVFLDATPNS